MTSETAPGTESRPPVPTSAATLVFRLRAKLPRMSILHRPLGRVVNVAEVKALERIYKQELAQTRGSYIAWSSIWRIG